MKNKLKNILQKINVFILSAVLVCAMLPVRADAAYEIPGTCQIQTDSGAQNTVKTLDYSYDRNTYFSLRDIAVLLNGEILFPGSHEKCGRPEPRKCLHACGR